MRKVLLILCLAALFAYATNPGILLHKVTLKETVRQKVQGLIDRTITPKKKWQEVLLAVGSGLATGWIDQKLDQAIEVDDYYLFSLTQVRIKGRNYTVGVGAFNSVWLFTDTIELIDWSQLG